MFLKYFQCFTKTNVSIITTVGKPTISYFAKSSLASSTSNEDLANHHPVSVIDPN